MGLSFEAPISRSSAHDKATRRDSPHLSTHTPWHGFKALRIRSRLSRHKSGKTPTAEPEATSTKVSLNRPQAVHSGDSLFFKLPQHLRERIYHDIIDPSGHGVLHILLKYNADGPWEIRFRACRASDDVCALAKCRSYLDSRTNSYRGAFDSVRYLLLVSKEVNQEIREVLYSSFEFRFETCRTLGQFLNNLSIDDRNRIRRVTFEPQRLMYAGEMEKKEEDQWQRKWQVTWQLLDELPSLELLRVRYQYPTTLEPQYLELLDPRKHISQRESLSIQVSAPWMKEVKKEDTANAH